MIDLSSPNGILSLIELHGYLFIFLIMILEGAIITYAAGFAASLGIFNIYIVLLLSILGNILADSIYYFIGRYMNKTLIEKKLINLISQERRDKISEFLKNHAGKTIFALKLTPGVAIPGLIVVGASKVDFLKFLFYSSSISVVYSLTFTLIGFYSGKAFGFLYPFVKYGEMFIGLFILFIVLIIFFLNRESKAIGEKIEKI